MNTHISLSVFFNGLLSVEFSFHEIFMPSKGIELFFGYRHIFNREQVHSLLPSVHMAN